MIWPTCRCNAQKIVDSKMFLLKLRFFIGIHTGSFFRRYKDATLKVYWPSKDFKGFKERFPPYSCTTMRMTNDPINRKISKSYIYMPFLSTFAHLGLIFDFLRIRNGRSVQVVRFCKNSISNQNYVKWFCMKSLVVVFSKIRPSAPHQQICFWVSCRLWFVNRPIPYYMWLKLTLLKREEINGLFSKLLQNNTLGLSQVIGVRTISYVIGILKLVCCINKRTLCYAVPLYTTIN